VAVAAKNPTPPLGAGGPSSFPQINLSGAEKNSGDFLNSSHYAINVLLNVDKHIICSPTHPMFKYLLPTCVCATLALTSITSLHAQENIPPPKKTDAASDVKKSLTPTPVPLPKKQKSESATPQNENPPPTAPPTRKKPARTATSQPPADSPADSEATESATSSNNLPPPAKRKIAEPKAPKETNANAPRTLKESAPAGDEVTSPSDEKQRVLAAKAARKLKPAQSASLLELINTGPATALEAVPGMDGARIKALRKARPFAEVSDLMAVSGLDPASFAAIIEWAKNGMPAPTAAPAP
jgi:DNA uptake protein ComE-like DNA-binding protein